MKQSVISYPGHATFIEQSDRVSPGHAICVLTKSESTFTSRLKIQADNIAQSLLGTLSALTTNRRA